MLFLNYFTHLKYNTDNEWFINWKNIVFLEYFFSDTRFMK